jgi:branched-chain amino acid aminotransferase
LDPIFQKNYALRLKRIIHALPKAAWVLQNPQGTMAAGCFLIWTDAKEHAYVEEMGAANVMFLLDGKLITPSTRDTILDGVTRDTVLTLAREWGYPVEERRVSVAEVIEGAKTGKLTDAFGAGTAATIASVASISLNGEEYFLGDVKSREFSRRVLSTLDDIKYGVTADTHGWNYLV